MEMGSPLYVTNSPIPHGIKNEMGRHTLQKKNYIHRPRFYPCEKCKKKFTIRALVVHKKNCTQSFDCCCSGCVNRKLGSKQESLSLGNHTRIDDEESICHQNESHNSDNQTLSSTNSLTQVQNGTTMQIVTNNAPLSTINVHDLKLEDSSAGNCKLTTQNVFVVEKDRSANSNSSGASGLLLLHNAARILAISGMKFEPSGTTDITVSKSSKTSIVPNGPIISGNTTGCPERQLLCCICNGFLSWEGYGSHVIQHAEQNNNELNCPKCMKKFTRAAMFLIHFNKHITDLSFVCRHCSMPFKLSDELKSHALNIHGYMETQPYHCYICMRRFSHPQTIINHMRLHSKETPFKCKECSRSFSQIGNLQRHLSVHRGDRPHKCAACDKSFADPATLRNHVRIHTGETPFVCKVCMRGFTQIGNLKRHMARHLQNKDKLFPSTNAVSESTNLFPSDDVENCLRDILSRAESEETPNAEDTLKNDDLFERQVTVSLTNGNTSDLAPISQEDNSSQPHSNSDSLDSTDSMLDESSIALSQLKEQRKRNKWQLFPCPVCGKVYTWQHDLTIHFRIHTGEKPYKCDICEKRFAQSGAVRIHKSRHHFCSTL